MWVIIRNVCVIGFVSFAAAWVTVEAILSEPPDVKQKQAIEDRLAASRAETPQALEPDAAKSVGQDTQTPPAITLYSQGFIDDSGYNMAYPYTSPINDRGSLQECLAAVRGRADRGIAELKELLERRLLTQEPTIPNLAMNSRLCTYIAILHLDEGRCEEAEPWVDRALKFAEAPGMPEELKANLLALRGVAAMRRGEQENCIACEGPSSCIFPLSPQAVHVKQDGSRAAIDDFLKYLEIRPEDVGVQWLLNIAAMTLGEYPAKVPPRFRIAADASRSQPNFGRFNNVAMKAGLTARGPSMSGGSLFDDFDGDGCPDIITTTTEWDMGASLFINRGDGTFEDRSESSGLAAEPMALNASHADFDNDGLLDVLIVRGGWEDAYPLSLMRNMGGGRFENVTARAGMTVPIASKSAAWGDYDNDGWIDVYVAGEYDPVADSRVADPNPAPRRVDRRNRSRLYHNNGDGTFTDVAERAGVLNERWAQGAVWGDYDGDNRPDLLVSNRGTGARLYHNNGDGAFTDVAPELDVLGPEQCFACWFWDYDNDGKLDISINGSFAPTYDVVSDRLGKKTDRRFHSRLYRNLGSAGFQDVTEEMGLSHAWLPMGANYGDIDNDGYLDIYLATGRPQYSALSPNMMLHNASGRTFENISDSSGTGHLQKGHGVSFADYDNDGDLDLFVQTGGAVPGDRAHDLLFENPGYHAGHWLKVRLVGDRTNRAAIGAKIRVDLPAVGDIPARSVYREISAGSSFGGNSLEAWIGLGAAQAAETLTVEWPATGATQVFHKVSADQAIQITEGNPEIERRAGESSRSKPNRPLGRSSSDSSSSPKP